MNNLEDFWSTSHSIHLVSLSEILIVCGIDLNFLGSRLPGSWPCLGASRACSDVGVHWAGEAQTPTLRAGHCWAVQSFLPMHPIPAISGVTCSCGPKQVLSAPVCFAATSAWLVLSHWPCMGRTVASARCSSALAQAALGFDLSPCHCFQRPRTSAAF